MAGSRHNSPRDGRNRIAVLLLVIGTGCSSHKDPAPAATGSAGSASPAPAPTGPIAPGGGPIADDYKADIENLCDVLKRSGADQLEPAQRNPTIAMWLGPHIKTTAGHDFLVKIGPLQGPDKAKALEDEAARVGIAACPLAVEWRAPGAVNPP
jgi:hypothetical protein